MQWIHASCGNIRIGFKVSVRMEAGSRIAALVPSILLIVDQRIGAIRGDIGVSGQVGGWIKELVGCSPFLCAVVKVVLESEVPRLNSRHYPRGCSHIRIVTKVKLSIEVSHKTIFTLTFVNATAFPLAMLKVVLKCISTSRFNIRI
ncbi:hypothetical protein ASF58_23065 [Methylobacterium sp. Leaf125]|nr:hypothetical protein ASF58_23065 [Methylobacterium sp. Leaf125]